MSSEKTAVDRLRVPRETRQLISRLHERTLRAVMVDLPSGEPRHYLYDLLPAYPARAGKGLRPALCMAACAAYGGSYGDGLPFAAALELLHNAFLVHDDIQDGSPVRRGRAALHVEYGTPLALNAGDALAARANAAFLEAARRWPPEVATALLEGWDRMTRETLEGQALDLGWQHHDVLDVSAEDYLDMCAKKTAWYTTIQPLAIGAILGSGEPAIERETFQFGWHLGLLFQLINDLDGVREDVEKSDIEEGKRTLLVIHLLGELPPADRSKFARIMRARYSPRPTDVEWVRDRMDKRGTIAYVESCVSALAAAAISEAEYAFGSLPASDARDLLLSVTAYVLEQSKSVSRALTRPRDEVNARQRLRHRRAQ